MSLLFAAVRSSVARELLKVPIYSRIPQSLVWASYCVPNIQVRNRSNRSRRGLYDGKDIRSGNNVSFSMKATKRKFKPNVFSKRVYSEILDDMIRFHLTTSTLRSIDKAGGLDNYLLKSKHVTEGEGYVIKKKILKRLKNQDYNARKAARQTTSPEAEALPS